MGAVIIEKRFTNNKLLPGNDHYHAMDINDLKNLKVNLNKVIKLLGIEKYKKPIKEEEISRKNARRSIVTKYNLKVNHILKEEDITDKRPGTGISPIYWDEIIGKQLRVNVSEDHLLKWSDLND